MIINKNKKLQGERSLKSLLDAYDADVVVVKSDDCGILSMNEAARARLDPELHSATNCKRGYSYIFPELCDRCTQKSGADDKILSFDTKDSSGRIFSVKRSPVEWLDGKKATAFIIRDVDDERKSAEKMYQLAYTDQLTGIPNRRRFTEDFEAHSKDIESGKLWGAVAIFDLDNFKAINDTYGHHTGDAMLRRLTSHFQSDNDFKGHIYRLGGDEFVLYFTVSPQSFDNQESFRSHFRRLLEKALLSYTMPNIEDECTLSIGAAFFPSHGDNLSELLRKADIALYKAKAAGRNQLVLFEDRYDAAKKFKDMYINMQPILIKNGKTYGYELIDSEMDVKDDDEVVSLSEFDRTLDALGLNEIKDSTKYFISFTKQLLNVSSMKNLPRDKFVVQIRACDKLTEERMQLYKQLRSRGFSISLTDVDSDNLNHELLGMADYCKFASCCITQSEQRRLIAAYPEKTFIASDVSTNDCFEEAQLLGFKLFQGFYFKQHIVTKKEKDIEPIKANYFRLLQLTGTDGYVDFNEISSVISSDVALSYKLLRLLNSASVGLRTRVSSILMAVTYLGEENLKQWIAVLALRGIAEEKPLELVRLSLIRAHFGELLAPCLKPKKDARHVFMTGLLSLLHIALDKTKEELLAEIPVADEIRESLLSNEGPYSDLIVFFKNYENSSWEEISKFSEKQGISCDVINDAYIKSVKWCNDLIDEV